METPYPRPILTRLAQIIATLVTAVWDHRNPRHGTAWGMIPPVEISIVMRVRTRLLRADAAIKRLMHRFHAGKLPAPATPGRTRSIKPRTRTAPAGKPLPGRFGWLCGLMPGQAAAYGNHLNLLLAEPEMQALLAASPRAVAILKPICRMLAIHPSILVPGAPKLGLPSTAPPPVYLPPIVPGTLIPAQFRILWRPQSDP